MNRARILIIDDDSIARRFVSKALDLAGYDWYEAKDGAEGLASATQLEPDLILLDRVMPQMEGIEVLQRLRKHYLTNHIPVIMLTSLDDIDYRVEGLSAGADDYVIKPFDDRDLLARVAAALRRSEQNLDADSLTRLPGNAALRRQLQRRLQDGVGCAVAYIDVDHFKAYVDNYGFEKAAVVIRGVAQIVQLAAKAHGHPDDFIGHIGGDDFLLIAHSATAKKVCQHLLEEFDRSVSNYYNATDLASGYIEGSDRYGTARRFPLLSLSIAIIEVPTNCTPDLEEISSFAGRCKQDIKNNRGPGWKRYAFTANNSSAVRDN
jgi:diguanylate cyclase (GGDEF)-like protein